MGMFRLAQSIVKPRHVAKIPPNLSAYANRPMYCVTPQSNITSLSHIDSIVDPIEHPSLPPPTRYRHYKGGEYMVIGEGIHTENEEEFVFYYSVENPLKLYARPKDMFYSDIVHNGVNQKRFTLIE